MRVCLCRFCLSLPRNEGTTVVFEKVGAGQECSACGAYVSGEDGVEVWRDSLAQEPARVEHAAS